jgi:hypothetical protein
MTAKQTDSRPNLTDGAQRRRYDVRTENPGVGTQTQCDGLELGWPCPASLRAWGPFYAPRASVEQRPIQKPYRPPQGVG